jgi:acyl-CoA synthetase (AMP-forming)/AMP-acid ligase II
LARWRSVNLNWRNALKVTEVLLTNLKPRVLIASLPFRDDASALHQAVGTPIALVDSICDSQPDQLPFAIRDELVGAYEALAKEARAAASPSAVAAVFFTGGTTGTPKAVPHTHAGLVWVARRLRAATPAPFAPDVEHRGTVCFTPFFHVMGFVANLVFNLVTGCRAAILSSHDAKLSPPLILAARPHGTSDRPRPHDRHCAEIAMRLSPRASLPLCVCRRRCVTCARRASTPSHGSSRVSST